MRLIQIFDCYTLIFVTCTWLKATYIPFSFVVIIKRYVMTFYFSTFTEDLKKDICQLNQFGGVSNRDIIHYDHVLDLL